MHPRQEGTVAAMTAMADPAPDMRHLGALDGIRAVSVLLVVLSHFGLGSIVPGGFGVTVFFFLSGFLISRQMLAGAAASGGIRVGNFYLRRVLRLGPPLLAMILASTLAMAAIGQPLAWRDYPPALLYYANYHDLYVGFDAGAGRHHPFQILWSLAVEQHFYLLLPLVLLPWWRRGRGLLLGFGLLALVTLAWRILLHAHCTGEGDWRVCGVAPEDRIYKATDARLDAILFGVMLTFALAGRGRQRVLAGLTAWPTMAAALTGLLLAFVVRDPGFRETWRYTIQGVALMPVFAAVLFAPGWRWARWVLTLLPMRLIGLWSYSIFLFHWLGLSLADHLPGQPFMLRWQMVAIGVTLVLGVGSYYAVERPLLAWRRRLGRLPAAPVAMTARPAE